MNECVRVLEREKTLVSLYLVSFMDQIQLKTEFDLVNMFQFGSCACMQHSIIMTLVKHQGHKNKNIRIELLDLDGGGEDLN